MEFIELHLLRVVQQGLQFISQDMKILNKLYINQLQPTFQQICTKIEERGLSPNIELAATIRQKFEKKVILQHYIDQLKKIIQNN